MTSTLLSALAVGRRPDLDRRLRHRLLVAGLPQAAAGRRGEDRPVLRERPRRRRRQHQPGRGGRGHRRVARASRRWPRASRRPSRRPACTSSAATRRRATGSRPGPVGEVVPVIEGLGLASERRLRVVRTCLSRRSRPRASACRAGRTARRVGSPRGRAAVSGDRGGSGGGEAWSPRGRARVPGRDRDGGLEPDCSRTGSRACPDR